MSFKTSFHCHYSMKNWRNWWHSLMKRWPTNVTNLSDVICERPSINDYVTGRVFWTMKAIQFRALLMWLSKSISWRHLWTFHQCNDHFRISIKLTKLIFFSSEKGPFLFCWQKTNLFFRNWIFSPLLQTQLFWGMVVG